MHQNSATDPLLKASCHRHHHMNQHQGINTQMNRSDRKGDDSKIWTGFDYYLAVGELGLPNGLPLGDLAFALLM